MSQPLDPAVRNLVLERHRHLLEAGKLLSSPTLERCYERFRERFGPEQLSQLDGVALLETMHLHGNRDSLVYWLEFKNDEEFPAQFGSIAGGSALKFRVYFSAEAESWVSGSPMHKQYLSEQEAVEIARAHRDQFLAGVALIQALPPEANDAEYAELQQRLQEAAPEVADSAWGHKYFSLLFPEKLDDYHAPHYQRHILTRCLQVPPEGEGRYVCAGRFMALRRELDLSMTHLSSTLNDLFGDPYTYWLLEMSAEDTKEAAPYGSVALGWPELGDLGDLSLNKKSKERVHELLEEHYPDQANESATVQQIFDFATKMEERDLVALHTHGEVKAIGRVRGDYYFEPESSVPHRHNVDWLSFDQWALPQGTGQKRTLAKVRDRQLPVNIERGVFDLGPSIWPEQPPGSKLLRHFALTGVPGRIQSVLERKGQVVLYGPPGTGKTYWAERAAKDLAALHAFRAPFEQLAGEQAQKVYGEPNSLVRQCTFHPAYGYEDFLEGYRPIISSEGELAFELRPGIFRRLCLDAASQPERNFYLIIDEINRGDIPRIFGELLTVLELSKREMPVILPLTGDLLRVPKNLFVIGTMNTADRSIALLDTALRRRFGFIEMMPDAGVLGSTAVSGIPLGPWLSALNGRLREHLGRDARNLQVGHSYLMRDGRGLQSFAAFRRALRDDLLPLLEEYCYDDWEALARILGTSMINPSTQRISEELFGEARESDLIQALLAPSPDIVTSPEATEAEAESEEVEEEEGAGAEAMPSDDEGEETKNQE